MTTDGIDRAALMRALLAAAGAAGDVVWAHFIAGAAVTHKADASPVTAADHEAEALILAALAAAAPGVPVVAEEEAAAGRVPMVAASGTDAFFLVDPLDGTREFVAGGDDFTVNIGLIEGDAPTMGVVYAPAHGDLYWGDAGPVGGVGGGAAGLSGAGAWHARRPPGGEAGPAERIGVRPLPGAPCAVASRSHVTPGVGRWLDAIGAGERVSVGSSLKFALVAAGGADVYPRTGPTMEWDTAAGDALLRAAGGMTFAPDGTRFRYGKPGHRNTGFVAAGGWTPPPIAPFCG